MDYSLNFIGTILSLLFLTMEAIAAILFFDSFFFRKVNNPKFFLICTIRIIIVFIVNEILPYSIFIKFLFTLLRFGESMLLYNGSPFKKFLCSSLVTTFFGIFDEIFFLIVDIILGITYSELIRIPLLYTVIVISQKLLLIFLAYIFKSLHPKTSVHILPLKALLAPILFSSGSSIFIVVLAYIVSNSAEISILPTFCIVLFVLISSISLVFLLSYLETSAKEKVALQFLKREEKIQVESINALREAYSAQRKASHEFNRHINLIHALLSENHPEEALKYVNKISNLHIGYSQVVTTNHIILDAIFNQKYSISQINNIEMEFQINDLSHVNLPNHYLVVLLCNLIDNAIEACFRLQHSRIIQIKMTYSSEHQEILLCIRNTALPVKIDGNSIQTTKDSSSEHGYGLPTVLNILQELNADFTFDYDDGWFQFTTIIPNPPLS